MGAGQSSTNGDAGSPQEVKTSYYDLLGVQRQATEEELKKAYRRKALELHPDRNHGNEETATKLFAEVQAAYEVLSDSQERAWYDSHESAILRGEDGAGDDVYSYQNIRLTTADDLARIVRKFNSNVEFTDAPSGFFGYLKEQFEHLAMEEDAAANAEDVDIPDYPTFGHSKDGHEDVVKQFYLVWANFSTAKTFAWKDKYRLSEAPDRRIRRLMEKENNSLRQESIREFNEAVRSLVAFVRKRDPRYQPSTQSEAERQKTLRDAAAAQAARARAANEAKLQGEVPEWATVREPEELEESEEEEVEQEVLECVACNKVFKSERQWEAHERSKKHQKAVHALQKKMRKENANLDLGSTVNSRAATSQLDEEDCELIDDVAGEDGHGGIHDEPATDNDRDVSVHDADETVPVATATTENSDQDETTTRDDENMSNGKGKPISEVSGSDDEDYASPETISERLQATSLDQSGLDESTSDVQSAGRKMGKAAQKRAKKAAATTATEQSEDQHKCGTCEASFPSRTRLFQHIKDFNHAQLKTVANSGTKTKKSKGKGKR